MEINCKIKPNLGIQVQHYGGGVVSIHTEYYNKYDLTEEFLTVLAELKENNPKLKVTTILFVDEHPQAKRTYKELIVNFEEKQTGKEPLCNSFPFFTGKFIVNIYNVNLETKCLTIKFNPMTKFEFNEKYEQFHDARKMSNIFVAIFFAAIILGIGSLVKFDPKPIWSAIIFGVTWIVALPSLLLFFNFGWEYEFIRRRLLKELKENKTLRQELEAEYS